MIDILQYPDPRLRGCALLVDDFGQGTQDIIDEMYKTLYGTDNCAGLAASQLEIKEPPHITVIDFSRNQDNPLCLINAKITHCSWCITNTAEACMSLPGIVANVPRAETVVVEAQDRYGKPIMITADGFLSKVIQHELDHLGGVLFIDHLE